MDRANWSQPITFCAGSQRLLVRGQCIGAALAATDKCHRTRDPPEFGQECLEGESLQPVHAHQRQCWYQRASASPSAWHRARNHLPDCHGNVVSIHVSPLFVDADQDQVFPGRFENWAETGLVVKGSLREG